MGLQGLATAQFQQSAALALAVAFALALVLGLGLGLDVDVSCIKDLGVVSCKLAIAMSKGQDLLGGYMGLLYAIHGECRYSSTQGSRADC